MFCSAEMVNKASATGDSGLKPLIFHQPCQQNSHLHPLGWDRCLSLLQISFFKPQLPWACRATSLVSSLSPRVQSSRELESSCVPALCSAVLQSLAEAKWNAQPWKGSVGEDKHRAGTDASALLCGHLLLGAPLDLLPWASWGWCTWEALLTRKLIHSVQNTWFGYFYT